MDERQRSQRVGRLLILFGVLALAGNWLPRVHDMEGPIVLLVVGAGLLVGWARSERVGLLIGGANTTALGIFALVDQVLRLGDLSGPLFFLMQGAAFYGVHLLDKDRPAWARRTALGLTGFAAFIAIVSGTGYASNIVGPVLLILAGLWLFIGRRS